jgi:GNAT superfamily N-acetyltransferase
MFVIAISRSWSPNTYNNDMASIRTARPEDAPEIAGLLVRSIREICGPDYNNDEELLDFWCSNKTNDKIASWIQIPDNYWIVAIEDDRIVGVGTLSTKGTIDLCYLLPEYVRKGIGTLILNALIANARMLGLFRITLESTRTAKEFYLRNGFEVMGETKCAGRIPGYSMEKYLDLNYA